MALPLLLEASRNTRPGTPASTRLGVAEGLMWIKEQQSPFLGIVLFSEGSCHFVLCFYAVHYTLHLSCPLFRAFQLSDNKYSLVYP